MFRRYVSKSLNYRFIIAKREMHHSTIQAREKKSGAACVVQPAGSGGQKCGGAT
jgi:hypothetical protein